jgi:hypothetical protein
MKHQRLLNISDNWLKYAIRLNLCHERKEDLAELRNSALLDNRIQGFLYDVARYHSIAVTNHKNPDLPIHKLLFLLGLGFDTDVPEIQMAIDEILKHKDRNGVFQSLTKIPIHFGGTGNDMFSWSLCDAPLMLLALLKAGINYQEHLKPGVDYLLSLCGDNGFPCATSQELGRFRGPGRKEDCCPYATLVMTNLLAHIPEYRDSAAAYSAVETLLLLWEHSREQHPYIFYMGNDFRKLKAPPLRSGFNTLVEVTLPCAAAEQGSALVQRYDEGRGEWELLPCSLDGEAGTVSFRTDHFSNIGVFEATGQKIPGSIFSYVGEYRGPLTPVMITSGDIRRFLASTDTENLKRFLRLAKIPEEDAESQGVWWLAAIMGGVGYAEDNGVKLLEYFKLMDEARWAKWSPFFTTMGAFCLMWRIGYQASRGVNPAAIVYDNAFDIVETMLSIAAFYTGAVPLAFTALGVYSVGQLYEAYKWASSETLGWEEYAYRYFNLHDAQLSLDTLDVVWEEKDREGYIRLDLGEKGCAAALDAIYRKYLNARPTEMLEAYERFIDDYCNLYWKADRSKILKYYSDKVSNNWSMTLTGQRSAGALSMANPPSAGEMEGYRENFRRMLLSALKPLLQEMVERLYLDIERELLNETRRVLLPILNKEMRFEAVDPDLDRKQTFFESRFSSHEAVISFEEPKSSPFKLWNYHTTWLDQYQPKAEYNSNTFYRCTWFHWLSIGQPQTIFFITNAPGENEIQKIKIEPKIPVTKVKLKSWDTGGVFFLTNEVKVPLAGQTIGSWEYTGKMRTIKIDITEYKYSDTYSYQAHLSVICPESHKYSYEEWWDVGVNEDNPNVLLFFHYHDDDDGSRFDFDNNGGYTVKIVNQAKYMIFKGYSLRRVD